MVVTQPGNRWGGDDPQGAGLQRVTLSHLLRGGAVRGIDEIGCFRKPRAATPYGTSAQQATQDYALEASFLRIITTPAIPRLSNNQEDDSGTTVTLTVSSEVKS